MMLLFISRCIELQTVHLNFLKMLYLPVAVASNREITLDYAMQRLPSLQLFPLFSFVHTEIFLAASI